jgi:hypothetical protein
LRSSIARAPPRPLNGIPLYGTGVAGETMNAKRNVILDRIKSFEQSIRIAREYLESGKHADWSGFRPLFDRKFKNGKELPPHKDWVKNVYLPRMERALGQAEKTLDRLENAGGLAADDAGLGRDEADWLGQGSRHPRRL